MKKIFIAIGILLFIMSFISLKDDYWIGRCETYNHNTGYHTLYVRIIKCDTKQQAETIFLNWVNKDNNDPSAVKMGFNHPVTKLTDSFILTK